MSESDKIVKLLCPSCKKVEETLLDGDEPRGAVIVEVTCSGCLEADDSLPIEPVFRDENGLLLRV